MEFALQIRQHPNVRYSQSLTTLAKSELHCMLVSCGIKDVPREKTLGGSQFLCFQSSMLTEAQLRVIHAHSALGLFCILEGDLLRPLDMPDIDFIPSDMPEILKYKGKTNASFTYMLINLALSASEMTFSAEPITLLDPLCGRGTTLYCALTRGMNATGVDMDGKELQDGIQFVARYLQYNKFKHQTQTSGLSLPGGKNAPMTRYTLQRGEEHRSISFIHADARLLPNLLKRQRFHLVVADLPYGVQHAPLAGQRCASLTTLLSDALPAWRSMMEPGGAIALAFNAYTLERRILIKELQRAGLSPIDAEPYGKLRHWVEQAVDRDVVVARNERREHSISGIV